MSIKNTLNHPFKKIKSTPLIVLSDSGRTLKLAHKALIYYKQNKPVLYLGRSYRSVEIFLDLCKQLALQQKVGFHYTDGRLREAYPLHETKFVVSYHYYMFRRERGLKYFNLYQWIIKVQPETLIDDFHLFLQRLVERFSSKSCYLWSTHRGGINTHIRQEFNLEKEYSPQTRTIPINELSIKLELTPFKPKDLKRLLLCSPKDKPKLGDTSYHEIVKQKKMMEADSITFITHVSQKYNKESGRSISLSRDQIGSEATNSLEFQEYKSHNPFSVSMLLLNSTPLRVLRSNASNVTVASTPLLSNELSFLKNIWGDVTVTSNDQPFNLKIRELLVLVLPSSVCDDIWVTLPKMGEGVVHIDNKYNTQQTLRKWRKKDRFGSVKPLNSRRSILNKLADITNYEYICTDPQTILSAGINLGGYQVLIINLDLYPLEGILPVCLPDDIDLAKKSALDYHRHRIQQILYQVVQPPLEDGETFSPRRKVVVLQNSKSCVELDLVLKAIRELSNSFKIKELCFSSEDPLSLRDRDLLPQHIKQYIDTGKLIKSWDNLVYKKLETSRATYTNWLTTILSSNWYCQVLKTTPGSCEQDTHLLTTMNCHDIDELLIWIRLYLPKSNRCEVGVAIKFWNGREFQVKVLLHEGETKRSSLGRRGCNRIAQRPSDIFDNQVTLSLSLYWIGYVDWMSCRDLYLWALYIRFYTFPKLNSNAKSQMLLMEKWEWPLELGKLDELCSNIKFEGVFYNKNRYVVNSIKYMVGRCLKDIRQNKETLPGTTNWQFSLWCREKGILEHQRTRQVYNDWLSSANLQRLIWRSDKYDVSNTKNGLFYEEFRKTVANATEWYQDDDGIETVISKIYRD